MIKTRIFPEANYKAVWFNGKTIRIALNPNKPITDLDYPEFYDVKITGKCKGKCPWCFLPGEKVNTENGLVNIENIKLDDIIFTFDEDSGETFVTSVDQLHITKYVGDIITIEFENGDKIKTTINHPFFTKNRGWVEAGNLNDNDVLFEL
jgi:hypothetical protein